MKVVRTVEGLHFVKSGNAAKKKKLEDDGNVMNSKNAKNLISLTQLMEMHILKI